MSRFLASLLKKEQEEKDQYAAAMKRALGQKAFMKSEGKYLSREGANERTDLR